jgi:hypothetical protein
LWMKYGKYGIDKDRSSIHSQLLHISKCEFHVLS